jgi:sn-glycerol 3-phosphate transport system ATP-binding protein
MASIDIRGVSKHYGEVSALAKVDLQVADGELCVILGPSGCGKSTLLQVVAGLMQQDEGSIWMDGRCIDRLSPRERDVAMVFQSYALYPHMTVYENMRFGLRMRGVSAGEAQERVLETARFLGLESLLKRKPRELSGGQRQRVAMGRALVRRPKLFLLDEPLSNLDALLRINVRVELKGLHRQIRGTVLYVTHDQVEAMTLGQKVVVMKEGRVRQVGTPEAVYDHPADTFVATFIGSPMMNLFEGRLVREKGRRLFRSEGLSPDPGEMADGLEGEILEVGIRPEDVSVGSEAEQGIQMQVDLVSNVGSHQYVHCRLGQIVVTNSISKDMRLRPGDLVPLMIPHSKLHLFHRGRRVPRSGKG